MTAVLTKFIPVTSRRFLRIVLGLTSFMALSACPILPNEAREGPEGELLVYLSGGQNCYHWAGCFYYDRSTNTVRSGGREAVPVPEDLDISGGWIPIETFEELSALARSGDRVEGDDDDDNGVGASASGGSSSGGSSSGGSSSGSSGSSGGSGGGGSSSGGGGSTDGGGSSGGGSTGGTDGPTDGPTDLPS